MDLRQLEYFLHVANTLNITHAASRAHVSQPALSRQIRLLEQEFGIKLFKRRVRGVVLTEAGKRLVGRTRILLANAAQIKSEMMSSGDEPVGTVRLGASNSLTHILTAAVVARFHQLYPNVTVQVAESTSMHIREAVVSDRADLALFSDRESFAGLSKIGLCTESLVLIAPREVGLEMSRPVSPKSLAGLDLILTPFPNGLRRAVDEILLRVGKISTPKMEVDTNVLMTSLIRNGTGFTVLPYSGVHDLLKRKDVSVAPIRNGTWSWAAATPRDRAMSSGAGKLLGMIIDATRQLVEDGTWRTAKLHRDILSVQDNGGSLQN